jgi:hypothetical protein
VTTWTGTIEKKREAPAAPTPPITTSSDRIEDARRYIAKMPPAISGQGGHVATFNAARKLADFGLSEEDIYQVLAADYNPRCEPPWSEKELRHKAAEAMNRGVVHPMEERRSREHHTNGSRTSTEDPPANDADADLGSHDEWPAPVAFDDVGQLPEFPVDALPQVIRDWAVAEAEATQTPVELAASMALAVISAAVQKRFEVQVRAGWREPLCAYWVLTMFSGERKSAVFRDATAATRSWESRKSKEAEPRIRAAVTQYAIKEKALAAAITRAAKSGSPSDKQLAEELSVELGATRIPVAPRITADDVTPEKLAHLLAEHGGRITIMSAEGGIFDTVAGRYSDGVANIDTLLKAHAGDDLRVDRRNSAPLHVQRPTLTMGLCVQPDVVMALASKETFRGRGLLARCLFILPQSKVGHRKISPAPVDALVSEAWEQLVMDMLDLPEQQDEDGEIRATVIPFSAGALAVLEGFAAELEPRLGPGGDLEPIRDWASKLAGATARIAGLLHLASGASGASGVTESSAQRAKEIGSFLLIHALGAFRMMGTDPVTEQARTILNHCLRRPTSPTSLTKRELWQKLRRGTFKTAEELDAPLQLLVDHGYIRVTEQPSKGGRKPSPVVEVNPRATRATNTSRN